MIRNMKQSFVIFFILFLFIMPAAAEDEAPLPVRVLILPKCEVWEITGDFPGEAQYY